MLRSGPSLVSKLASVMMVAAAAAVVVVIAAAEIVAGDSAADPFHYHRPMEGEQLHPFIAGGIFIDDDQTPIGRRFLPAATTTSDLVRNGGFHRRPQQRGEEQERFRCLPGIREGVVDANLLRLARGGGGEEEEAMAPLSDRLAETIPPTTAGYGGSGPAAAFSSAAPPLAVAVAPEGGDSKRSDGLHHGAKLVEIARRVDAVEGLLNETTKGIEIVLNVISTILYALAMTCLLNWLFRRF
jgi:hypothetical protein